MRMVTLRSVTKGKMSLLSRARDKDCFVNKIRGETRFTNKFPHIPIQNVKASTTKICGHMDWEKGDLQV